MSQEVDSRVVEMRFDNANFEKNTKQTISTIDRLMEKLQFKGAEKGFEKLDAAAENVDFATMQTSLDRLESKFSSLNIVATTALVNITNKFVDAGEKLVKSLSIDQVASGWDKYTEKTSNVQTIMNATGKSIDQVNGYLNKLMWYSDETSYSFSEMTSALSQMTAAGGNIDKMIPMIMGIANATADAGKTGFAFQSTIRNLTQSYSAGHLQLQDWKSLNLMGTATKALKQELIDTAVELGTLKKGEVTIGTFESSLSKKWANTKVMEKTFEKYASMMEAAYEMTQKNKGMTSSEALEKLSGQYGELAERAALAAQQATSFGQAIDSTKDTVSSKWMAVFETFFGNKEEATETWTELSDRLYDIFVPSIDGLNERLKDGLNSGWAQLQGRLGDQADAYSYTLQQVALASGAVTEEQITEAGSFTKALQQNGVSAQLLKASLDEAQTSAEKLLTLSDKEMAAKHYDRETIQRDAEAFAKLNAEIQNGTLDLDEYAQKIGELSGREHLVQSFWNIMDAIGKVVAPVKEAFSEIFPPADGERIYSFAERLDLMTQKLIITDQTAEKIKKTFKGLFTVLKGVTTILSKIGAVAKEAFSLLANAAKPVAQVMLSVGAGLGDFLETIYKVATGSGTLREKLGGIKTALTKLLSPVDALGSMLKSTKIAQYIDTFLKKGEESTGLLGTLYSVGRRAFDGLSAVIRTAASGGIGILGALGMAISTLLSKLGGLGENAVQVLGLTKPNLEDFQQNLIDMPKNLSKSMSEFASSFQRSMNKINGSVGDAFAPVKQFFTAVKEGFDAISGTDVYRFMSLIDVGLLAFSIGQMAKATKSLKTMLETPLTGMLNSISGTFKQLTSAIKTWQKNESTKTLTGMATAILILAGAMYVMSRINPDQFTEIAITVFGFVTLLTVSAKLLEPTTKRFTKAFDNLKASALNAATLWGTAAALIGLGIAIGSITKGLSRVMEVLQKGDIAANAAALAVVTASIVAMMLAMRQLSLALVVGEKAMNHKVILSTAVELVALSGAIKVLSTALKPLSEIKFTSLVKAGMAVVSLGGLLTTMATALAAVNKVIGPTGFQNGAAIAAMAGGIWIAAQAVSSLANIQLVRLDAAMTSIKTLMLLMTTMSAFSAKTKFGSGAAILVMSTSLIVLAGAVGLFAAMGDAAVIGLTEVGVAIAAITAASRLAGADGAASILTISSAMLVLAGAVAIYAALGNDAWVNFAKVAIGLGEMMAAVALLARMSGEGLQAAWVINTLSGGMIKLAAACAIFNFVKWGSLLSAGVALSGMIAILLGAGALNSVFPMLSAGLTVLGTAFDKFASGALKLTGAMAIIGVLSMFAGPICTAIINAAPDIQEALIAVVKVLCNTIIECAEPIALALTALGTAAIVAIVKLLANLWEMIEPALDDLWSKFKGWCAEHNPFDPANWGGTSDKISTNAQIVQKSFWQPFADILDELKNGDSFAASIYQMFAGVGKNASEGVAKGQLEGKKDATDASEEVANAVIDTSKTAFDTHSPSKVMAQIGQYVTLGLAQGIADPSALAQAKANMLHAATSIRNVFTTFWGIHSPSDVAASDAENILEGAILGIGDKTKQDELRNSTYNAALAVKDGMTTALDEATIAVQNSMVGLYNAMKMDSLHLGNPVYQHGLKGAQNAAKQAAQDTVPIPSNSGIKKPGNKTPSTVEEIKNAVDSTWGKMNPFGALTDYYQSAVDDALDGAGGGTTKSKASKAGKSLADTLASAFSDKLKANKTEMSNATGEYALWEVTGGDTATVEELITKKTESLTREIELQTKRVGIAKEQYDTLLAKVGANNSKTKDAYGTLLSEQKTLAELQRSKQDSILKVIQERYETDAKTAEDEYELWSALYEDSAEVTEKSNKKIDYINRKIKNQAEILLATEKDYIAIKNEFGEASQKTQAAYQQYLEAQTEQQKLINELNQAQLDAYDSKVSYLEKQEKLVTNRQNMLAKLYGDGDLAGREDAYKAAVEQYGADSVQARKAATQGTMTAIIGVGTALDSMSYSLKKVTNKQLKYDEAVKKFGKNSETALDALADLQSEQYSFVGFAENLADAFELDDSGKRMMMQLGYSISKNWRPIQEGFNSVWAQVQKSAPEMASKLSRAFGVATQDGVTEVITDLFGTITALVSGDWGGAVTGGITTVLDFMGSEFGQTMMNLGKTMLTFNKLAQGGGTLKVLGQVVKVTGATKNLGSILDNMGGLLGSATGGTGLLGEALGGLGSIGEMITGSGGLLGGLGELGGTLMSVLGSIGPEGWLIGAAIAGGGLLIANWDKIGDFFSGFFDWLGNAFSHLWDWISNGFKGLVDVGGNLISGLWQGITGAAGAVWNGICDFGSSIVNGFCDFFGIHSPSRVMAGIGEYLSLGLAQGITDETDSVVQGVQDVSDTALSTMMDLAQRVGDIASDDFEYEPSIQPVVDMSDVQNGVDWLNDTLFQNGTVALNAERTAGLAANVVRRAEVTKAQQEEANKADQKANPNADIVSSVEALGEHIDSIARAVANMKVQMNGRKLVGEIINDMDEGLGKINRRNNR
jgi:phage-related protein